MEVSKCESARGDKHQKTRRRAVESGRKGLMLEQTRAEEHHEMRTQSQRKKMISLTTTYRK
jgi:hypothetical protein